MSADFTSIINSKRPVLIDFYEPANASSKSESAALVRVKNCLQNQVSIIKLNASKNTELIANYKISSFPTLMLFRNGKQLWRHAGFLTIGIIILKIIEKNTWDE